VCECVCVSVCVCVCERETVCVSGQVICQGRQGHGKARAKCLDQIFSYMTTILPTEQHIVLISFNTVGATEKIDRFNIPVS
jgi:hypothetical protein